MSPDLKQWLPTTRKEMELRGWTDLDVILFSGDAYVDHPSFANAVVGRIFESEGLRVAIVPQPDWRGDHRDFTKLGRPNLFFAVSAGNMDSMVNHYTARKRLRSDDAYTPDGRSGMRPDYPTVVYTHILKKLYPDTPVVIGGIEASLRRLAHYDYWKDALAPSILTESGADLLVYGQGELPLRELVGRLKAGVPFSQITDLPQTIVYSAPPIETDRTIKTLYSFEECQKDRKKQVLNFAIIETESNKLNADILCQDTLGKTLRVNPPYATFDTEELDRTFALPFTRRPHPKYKEKHIPAYEMIKFSVNIHRGCFGGCAFCTISAHQGKFIVSRSESSILKEIKQIAELPDFKGYLSDLGGPSANMYRMKGEDESLCAVCAKPSCIFPKVCKNLNVDHRPLLKLYRAVDQLPFIRKSFIGSGLRYDMMLHRSGKKELDEACERYTEEVIEKHVSGRLKVAPEHTDDTVLSLMRKPSFSLFNDFKKIFDRINKTKGLNQQLIPYFISAHPGCRETDMAELAVKTKHLNYRLEQIQDFTPTPMTLASEVFYAGYNPYTKQNVYSAKNVKEKIAQSRYFFWYLPENRTEITASLKQLKRMDLLKELYK